eukprot:m.193253 g.193253  ORF g.193253 m.193253 type:complete len:289 (-) comp18880_c0_seq1:1485-2351(-)
MPRRRKRPSSRKPVTTGSIGVVLPAGPAAGSGGKPSKAGKNKAHAALISAFHAVNKKLAHARDSGDSALASELQAQLDAMGGLEQYQRASVKGEDLRATNTSKWLLKHLEATGRRPLPPHRLVLLDVGALRINYAHIKWVDADAIDLNAQVSAITAIDFFDYEPTHREGETPYDVVSLSLVVNFVPEPRRRGEMLRRACRMVKPHGIVFIVLPRACVENSRYTTVDSLQAVCEALGLTVTKQHLSAKLVYFVCELTHPAKHRSPDPAPFKRRLLRPGADRNNFHVGLE